MRNNELAYDGDQTRLRRRVHQWRRRVGVGETKPLQSGFGVSIPIAEYACEFREILERFQNTPSLRSVSAKMPWSVVRSLALNDWVRVKRYRGPRSRSG